MERLDPFRREKKLCKLSVQCDTHHLTDSLQSGFSEEGGLHASGGLNWEPLSEVCAVFSTCNMKKPENNLCINLVLCNRVSQA